MTGGADWLDLLSGVTAPDFDGGTYDRERDHGRLGQQMSDTYELFRDGQWRTLHEASTKTGHPEASISARLRDFRKRKFMYLGMWMESEYLDNGLWRYRLIPLDAAELARRVQEEENRVEALKAVPDDDLRAIELDLLSGDPAAGLRVLNAVPALLNELRGLRKLQKLKTKKKVT